MNGPYLSETPEFRAAVRNKRLTAVLCLLVRIVNAALGGYLSELRHMLDAASIGQGR
jgi:hypothetical protein